VPPRPRDAAAIGTEFTARGVGPATFACCARPAPKPVRASLIAASPELPVSCDRLDGLIPQRVLEHVGEERRLENFGSVRGPENRRCHVRLGKGFHSPFEKNRSCRQAIACFQVLGNRPEPLRDAQVVVNVVLLLAERSVLPDELQNPFAGSACLGKSQPKAAIVEWSVKAKRTAARVDVFKLAGAVTIGVAATPAFHRVSVLIHRPFKMKGAVLHRAICRSANLDVLVWDPLMLRKNGLLRNRTISTLFARDAIWPQRQRRSERCMSIHSTGIGDDEALHNTAGVDRRLTYSVPEAARALGISRGAAYAAAAGGTIPTIRIGRRLLVPRAALARLLGLASASEETGT